MAGRKILGSVQGSRPSKKKDKSMVDSIENDFSRLSLAGENMAPLKKDSFLGYSSGGASSDELEAFFLAQRQRAEQLESPTKSPVKANSKISYRDNAGRSRSASSSSSEGLNASQLDAYFREQAVKRLPSQSDKILTVQVVSDDCEDSESESDSSGSEGDDGLLHMKLNAQYQKRDTERMLASVRTLRSGRKVEYAASDSDDHSGSTESEATHSELSSNDEDDDVGDDVDDDVGDDDNDINYVSSDEQETSLSPVEEHGSSDEQNSTPRFKTLFKSRSLFAPTDKSTGDSVTAAATGGVDERRRLNRLFKYLNSENAERSSASEFARFHRSFKRNCNELALIIRDALLRFVFLSDADTIEAGVVSKVTSKLKIGQVSASMSSLTIEWNPRLLKTAGLFRCAHRRSSDGNNTEIAARIELSSKVCTDAERLRDTLSHEFCHAAERLIDGSVGRQHGPQFWKWARKVHDVFPAITVTQKHSYQIHCKFLYKCGSCENTVKRHSKSLDLQRFRCGRCSGRFELFRNTPNGPVSFEETRRKSTAFSRYVRENMASVRSAVPAGTPHSDVMRTLGAQFRQMKLQQKASDETP